MLNYHILRQINTKQSKFISNLQKTVGSLESRVSELEAKLILKSEFQELHLKITTLLAQHGIRHKEDAVEVDEEGSSGLDIVKQYSKRTESFDMLAE